MDDLRGGKPVDGPGLGKGKGEDLDLSAWARLGETSLK